MPANIRSMEAVQLAQELGNIGNLDRSICALDGRIQMLSASSPHPESQEYLQGQPETALRTNVPNTPSEELDAVQRALGGELDAFNELVIKYERLAYSVAYRMLQSQDAAADAVQDSFIKAYRALDRFKGGLFKSWLMRIVVNTCYDVLRVRKRFTTQPIEDERQSAAETDGPAAHQLIDPSESPQSYVERLELGSLIEYGIQLLPPDQRLVLVLCDIHGYAYDEIAEMIGFPMGTVKSRISRARTKLRDYLLENPELLPASLLPKHR